MYHLTTSECAIEIDIKKLLDYLEHRKQAYIEFGTERFVPKTKSYHAQLKKVLLSLSESNPKKSTCSQLSDDKFKLKGQAIDQKKFPNLFPC